VFVIPNLTYFTINLFLLVIIQSIVKKGE